MLFRRVLRRRVVRVSTETEGLRRVLRRERFRRQRHVLSQSTTPFACTLLELAEVSLDSIVRDRPQSEAF